MAEGKESLSGFEFKPNKDLEKQVEAEFKEDFVVDVEEEKEEEKMKEGEEEKEESTEQKKERYIDILVGTGFLKGKDKGDGKERYYYKIDDNSAVGRTFDSRTPLGKFWAKINGEWLKGKECKEVEIIKRFYAIRGGEEEMPEKKEEEKREIAIRGGETVEIKPNAVVQDAQAKADMLYSVVEKQHLYQEIRGKKYLQLEAWQTLGKFCNVTGEIEWVKPVEMWDARGFEARAVIKTVELTRNEEGGTTIKVGDTIAVAESMCMNDEENWQGKPMFQLKSMSQTRALSKAYRSCLSFIVALAGYAATPAEEM